MEPRDWDPRVVLVAGLCVYEVAAIASGRVPTITALAWKLRKHPVGHVAIWGALGWLSWHLLVEE